MRVLVTGAAGFVGRALVARVAAAGHAPVALLHRAERTFPAGVEVRRADLTDQAAVDAAVRDVEAVCHLAALTRVRESFTDPLRFFRVNVGGTLAVLDPLARRREPARLVFASTGAVYGVTDVQPTSEREPPAPTTPYAASKYAAELAVQALTATGRLGAVTLRAFNVAGASAGVGDDDLTRVVPKAVAVAAGRQPVLEINGDGSAIRDFVHVDDLAEAFVLALEACQPGEYQVYNVGNLGLGVSEVIESVERVTGRAVPARHLPPKPEPAVVMGDSTRIRAELGWKPWRSTPDQIVSDAWHAETRGVN